MEFWGFLTFEFNRFYARKILCLILATLLLSIYFVNIGIQDYRVLLENSREFRKCEKLMIGRIQNYSHYSSLGIRFLFEPGPTMIFFSQSPWVAELSSNFDSVGNLNVFNNAKNESEFSGYFKDLLNFSGILFILGSLFSLLQGYNAFRSREYMRFLSSISSRWKPFVYIVVSRLLLLNLTFLVITWLMVGFVAINGIRFSGPDFTAMAAFSGCLLLFLSFFFALGVLLGLLPRVIGKTAIIVIWLTVIALISEMAYTSINKSLKPSESSFKILFDKLTMIDNFEKNSEKNYGKFNRNKLNVAIDIVEGYWKNDFIHIIGREKALLAQKGLKVRRLKQATCFFPVNFYQFIATEAGSRGYENYLAFFSYTIDMNSRFVRFWIDRVFYNDPKVIVPFIKSDENIFKAPSRVPDNFFRGMAINLAYCLILLIAGAYGYRLMLTGQKNKTKENALDQIIRLEKGKVFPIFIASDSVSHRFFNRYSREDGFTYICNPNDIPGDIRAVDFARFISRTLRLSKDKKDEFFIRANLFDSRNKRFKVLSMEQKGKLWLALVQQLERPFYLVNKTFYEMSFDFSLRFKEWIDVRCAAGATVIYITSKTIGGVEDKKPKCDFEDYDDWAFWLTSLKKLLQDIHKEDGN